MDENITLEIVSIKKNLYKILTDKIKKYNLNLIEGIYLIIINNKKNVGFKELTMNARCDKGMTTKVISSLKEKGLVIIENKEYLLTPLGTKTSKKILKIFESLKIELIDKFGLDELTSLKNELKRLNNILEEIIC